MRKTSDSPGFCAGRFFFFRRLRRTFICPSALFRTSHRPGPDLLHGFPGLVLVYRYKIGLHILILLIKNKIAFQRGGIAVFKKKPGFLFIHRSLPDSDLSGKISSCRHFPSGSFFCRTINKIVPDFSFCLRFSIQAEIRGLVPTPVLGKICIYVVFYVYFVTGVHVACLYHIFRNLHTATAFFSFNIAKKGRTFWRNARQWLYSFRQKTVYKKPEPHRMQILAFRLIFFYSKRKMVTLW